MQTVRSVFFNIFIGTAHFRALKLLAESHAVTQDGSLVRILTSSEILRLKFHCRIEFPQVSSGVGHPSLFLYPVADPAILKGAKDNVSAPSSFIANAHNKRCVFYTGKGGLMKKNRNQ